jgi:hypothetical protein
MQNGCIPSLAHAMSAFGGKADIEENPSLTAEDLKDLGVGLVGHDAGRHAEFGRAYLGGLADQHPHQRPGAATARFLHLCHALTHVGDLRAVEAVRRVPGRQPILLLRARSWASSARPTQACSSEGQSRHQHGLAARRRGDRMKRCPLLAQSRHADRRPGCPLSGVKRTSFGQAAMSANDPKRTSHRPKINFTPLISPLWTVQAKVAFGA